MGRRTIFAAVLAGSLGIVGLVWWRCQRLAAPLNDLSATDVETMTAEVFGPDVVLRAVPPTNIPAEYVPFILDTLRPAERDDAPFELDEHSTIGKITILERNGNLIEVTFPWRGKYRLCYRLNGVSYVRSGKYEPVFDMVHDGLRLGYSDESLMLAHAICEIHREQVSGNKSENLTDMMQDFERSRGKRAPRKDFAQP